MHSFDGPDRTNSLPTKPTGAAKGLDANLECKDVAPTDLTASRVILPPLAPDDLSRFLPDVQVPTVPSRDAELPPVPRVSDGFQCGPSMSFSAEEVLAAGLDPEGMAEFRLGPEEESGGELQYRATKESDWETVDYYEVKDAGSEANYHALCGFIADRESAPSSEAKNLSSIALRAFGFTPRT